MKKITSAQESLLNTLRENSAEDMKKITSAQESLLNTLRDLVAFESVSAAQDEYHRGQIQLALDYVAQRALQIGTFHSKRIVQNGSPSLIIGTEDTLTPDIGLSAHIDVVSADKDMFIMKQMGDHLLGRGVTDMKFALAIFLEALQHVPRSKGSPSIQLLITSDEEIGGRDGARHLAEDLGYRPKLLLVPDGGGGRNWKLSEKAKGSIHISVEVNGVKSHASRPWEGKSATAEIVLFTAKMLELFPAVTSPDWNATTMNISILRGGGSPDPIDDSINSVAAYGKVYFDFRYAKREKRQRIIDLVYANAPADAIVSFPVEAYFFEIDPAHPQVHLFTDIIQAHTGATVDLEQDYGSSDARFFNQYGVPCIVLMPPSDGGHTQGEWMSAQGMFQYYEALVEFLNHPSLRNA